MNLDAFTELRRLITQHIPEGPERDQALATVHNAVEALLEAGREKSQLESAIRYHIRAINELTRKLQRGDTP